MNAEFKFTRKLGLWCLCFGLLACFSAPALAQYSGAAGSQSSQTSTSKLSDADEDGVWKLVSVAVVLGVVFGLWHLLSPPRRPSPPKDELEDEPERHRRGDRSPLGREAD